MCDWAVRLTLTPGAMDGTELALLRQHGFSDEQISIAAQVVSYFNYINRIADGLGVDPESWMTPPEDAWRRDKRTDYPIARG